MRRMTLPLLIAAFGLICCGAAEATEQLDAYRARALDDQELPDVADFFREHGIGEEYSLENLRRLDRLVESELTSIAEELSEIEETLASGSGDPAQLKKRKKDLKERKAFLKYSGRQLEGALAEEASVKDKISAFYLGKRIIYVVETLKLEDESTDYIERLEGVFGTLGNAGKILKRHLFTDTQLRIQYLAADDLGKPIGREQAAREARFLVDPADPGSFVPAERLARMSPREVAALEIDAEHPVWHTAAYLEEHPDGWRNLEEWLQKRLTKKLEKDHGIEGQHPGFSYRISAARRVLFFDEIKDSSSSPKIKAEDAFGVGWKVKWGDEVQTEVVSNRLWMKLGGKYTDLVYANGRGEEHLVLVLADPAKAEEHRGKDCRPVRYEELASCLKESRYNFNLDPYKLRAGVLSRENIDSILANLPAEALDGYRKEDLLGRHYVTFRESLVEIKPPKSIARRGGAACFSDLGARRDRVARGLLLFNMWIWNRDAKDDNNRAMLLSDLDGKKTSYVEMQHDLGASLGGLLSAGTINYLAVEEDFARAGRTGSGLFDWLLSPKKIFFRQFVLYYPEAWRDTTYADALWMGGKLAALGRADLEKILSHTGWPDFMQKALTYKLLARRNQIAALLHLEVAGDAELTPLRFEVPLATAEQRRGAADRYGIDVTSIERAMRQAELLDRGFVDRLVVDGQVSDCESTILMGILQRQRHPSGLAERVSRLRDDRTGDRGCEYSR